MSSTRKRLSYVARKTDVTPSDSLGLWQKAYDVLRAKDKAVIPTSFATQPADLIVEVEKYIAQSKGKSVKLPNGENLFVRDVLQKVARWIKKFVEAGDVAVQYDPGHAALPWALLRLVLQASINNIEEHAAVLEGIEKISYYLAWSKIEEIYLAIPFEAHAQLELDFIQLYTAILTFTARALRFLRNKTRRLVTALFSSGSKFQEDIEQMASKKTSIESYTRQISDQTNRRQYDVILRVEQQLADLSKPMVRIEHMVQSTSTTMDRAENQRILDWASTIPFQKHFNLARGKALEGTGQWLFRDPEYSTWEACSRSQILWLHGKAGSGKSTLISMVIQSLIRAHEVQQAPYPIYFFCSRNAAESERADPEHILRSLMRQASDLPGGPPLHHILKDRYDKRRVAGDVSAQETSEIIIKTIESRPLTYLVIDALDECDRQKREILIDALKTILTESNSMVKIFVTSRDNHSDIAWSMNGFPAVCIDATRNHADIVHYVQNSVQSAINKRKLLPTEHVTPKIQDTIVDSLCNGADGMFRWVELQLEFLYTLKMRSVLLKRLEQLPPGLEKIYEELYEYNIQELGDEQAEVVRKILSWLLVAKVPLRTSEFCRLVCAPDELNISIETVLDMSFDLLRLDAEQDQFRFSHLSVREFLEKRQKEFRPVLLHSLATCACLSLLTSLETINAEDYAALYWPAHAEDATREGGDEIIERQLGAFLRTRNSHFKRWNDEIFQSFRGKILFFMPPTQKKLSQAVVTTESPLLIAACFALSAQLQKIINDTEQPIDIELDNEGGERALYLASQYGTLESVRVLIEKGADVNAQGGDYGNALQAASVEGHTETVKLLIEKGADINAQGGDYGNALQAASVGGHTETVKLLLEKGADVNAQGGDYGNALQAASVRGHTETVKLLIEKGADINAQGGDYGNALQAASVRGHTETVKLLLEKAANADLLG